MLGSGMLKRRVELVSPRFKRWRLWVGMWLNQDSTVCILLSGLSFTMLRAVEKRSL